MGAQVRDVKDTIGEQGKRITNAANVLQGTKRVANKNFASLEKNADDTNAKHSKAIRSIEERLTRQELGDVKKSDEAGDSRSVPGTTTRAGTEWQPRHAIHEGWPDPTPRETKAAGATRWINRLLADLKDTILESYTPKRYRHIAKCEVESAAFRI